MFSRESGWSLHEYLVPQCPSSLARLWALGQLWPTPCPGVCFPRSIKKMCHANTGKKNTNMTAGMNKYPIDIQLQLLKTLTGCLEIAFLNVMGFGSFNHVMNIYFFLHLFIIGRNWVMDFSTDAPSLFTFPLLPLALLSDNAQQEALGWYTEAILLSKASHLSPSSPLRCRTGSDKNDWFYLHFWYIFLWMAARANTIFKIKCKTVMISNDRA